MSVSSMDKSAPENVMTTVRTKDTYQQYIYDFMRDIYVMCPSCGARALVKSPEFKVRIKNEDAIKLVCTKCGHSKRFVDKPAAVVSRSANNVITGRYFIIGATIDPYFHLPLWLTINCCDHVLWAYNYEHLHFLERHVEAKLRERNRQEMLNKGLGSRLPKWMTSKKNREAILKAIHQLASKVDKS